SVGRAAQLAAGVGAVSVLARFGPTRRALLRYRPSGEGPSAEVREKSFFSLTFVGKAGDATVVTRVSGGDPGYTETSRMLAHAGLLLARRESELPPAAGVSTPAIAFGPLGIDAMREAGLRFEVMPPGATGT
ncbi:MAG: saccharopine dehydrogenase, partial [Myxococcota bacterium]